MAPHSRQRPSRAPSLRGMNFAERAARNEEIFRGVNERIEEGAEKHGATGRQPFHCECGRIVAERYRFVVIAGHEVPEVERVVERRPGFVVVEKIGEAREQIDRDHPQQRHSD